MMEKASPPLATPSGSIVWRMDTRSLKLQFLSRDIEALLGFPCERFYEPGFWPSCIHPEDRARALDLIQRGAAGEPVSEFEYRVLTASGQTLWFRTVVRLTGVPGELLGVSFDHTARRRADALLAGDVRILEMVARARPLPEVLQVLVEVIEEWSEGMIASILRVEEGVRVRHLTGPRLPEAFTRAIDGLSIGPENGSCGTAAYRRETVVVEDIATDPLWARYREYALPWGLRACWSVPIKAPDQTVLGTFALYYKEARRPTPDLLELARHAAHLASVAMERERREEALRISEEHRSLIYRHVDDVLFHLRIEPGGEYRFLSMNPAFTRSTGLPASQVLGKSVRDVIPEPSLSTVLSNYERAIRTNRTVRWDEESRYPTGDRLGEVTITPVLDAEGRPQFLVGSVHDLTERRKLEEENRQLQKLETVGRLTGGVAHDLNNLMTVVLGYGTLLLGQLPPESAVRGDLEEILGAGRRASDLTRQLLAFARKQTLEPRRIDLSKLVAGLERLLRRLIRENIAFKHSLAPDLGPVLADPGQIEQVVINLAINARDAISGPGVITFETANVELNPDQVRAYPGLRPGPHVMLAISDNGSGMDEATQRQIFEPFFTTKETGKGTGLGLATVQGIVHQSGGHVGLSSAPGRGTTFKILFPRSGTSPDDDRVPDAPASWGARGEQILVVEDEPALRALFERMLRGLKYDVSVFEHAEAALDAADRRTLHPDLLLTDLILPGMTGSELAGRFRKRQPRLKVMYMSGYPEKILADQRTLEPGTTFLEKPFNVDSLASALRKVLEAPFP